jgi:3-deoxy-D-manno-octulosonate 8-phosphate phosphatase (KDO 8-P phosphatase)
MRVHLNRLKKIKMLILDVDGVLTDGRLWVTDAGKWCRFFNVRDGVGIKLLMEAGYQVGVISGGKSDDVIQRMTFLNIPYFYLEAGDKMPPYLDILQKTGLKEDEIAFCGDEVFDIPILDRVGFATTVPDAVPEVKRAAHYVTKQTGGMGAAREVADLVRLYGAFSTKSKTAAVGKAKGKKK